MCLFLIPTGTSFNPSNSEMEGNKNPGIIKCSGFFCALGMALVHPDSGRESRFRIFFSNYYCQFACERQQPECSHRVKPIQATQSM